MVSDLIFYERPEPSIIMLETICSVLTVLLRLVLALLSILTQDNEAAVYFLGINHLATAWKFSCLQRSMYLGIL